MNYQGKMSFISFALSTILICAPVAQAKHKPQAVPVVVATATVIEIPQTPTIKDGFYLGGGIGFDLFRVRQNFTSTASLGGLTTTPLRENPELMIRGFKGELFAGYDHYFRQLYYLGAEISGSASNGETDRTMTLSPTLFGIPGSLSYHSKVTIRNTYGVSILPGIKLDANTLVYARIGYSRANIKDDEMLLVRGINVMNMNSATWTNGFALGLGIHRPLTQNISIRGEYTFTNYGTINNSFSSTVAGVGTFNTVTQLRPYDNHLILDFIYHIG